MNERDQFELERAERLVHRLRKIILKNSRDKGNLINDCNFCGIRGHAPTCEVVNAIEACAFVFDAEKTS